MTILLRSKWRTLSRNSVKAQTNSHAFLFQASEKKSQLFLLLKHEQTFYNDASAVIRDFNTVDIKFPVKECSNEIQRNKLSFKTSRIKKEKKRKQRYKNNPRLPGWHACYYTTRQFLKFSTVFLFHARIYTINLRRAVEIKRQPTAAAAASWNNTTHRAVVTASVMIHAVFVLLSTREHNQQVFSLVNPTHFCSTLQCNKTVFIRCWK